MEEDIDMSLESLFCDQDLVPSTTNEQKIIEKEINKSISSRPSHRQTIPSPLAVSSEVSPDSKSSSTTTEAAKEDHLAFLFVSSNENENNTYYNDSNGVTSDPVVKGDITVGTSTRGGRMIFMNQYGYVYMKKTKTTVGYRCVKRNETCKAAMFTFKSSEEFSHWNGKYHYHLVVLSDSRRLEILTKINNRVLDEFISIKSIIEEEYRKGNLSIEKRKK